MGEQVVRTVGRFYRTGEQVVRTDGCFYQTGEQVIQTAGRFYQTGDQAIRTDANFFERMTQVVRTNANFFQTGPKRNFVRKRKAVIARFRMKGHICQNGMGTSFHRKDFWDGFGTQALLMTG